MPVPDGLDGVRVDAGLAKMLGFSRTFAAEVAEAGGVAMDGAVLGKSDRLRAGSWLDVSWEARQEPTIVPVVVSDLGIVYDDDDIVVVDKPTGVAAHPSVGWEGPTVLGALAGAGSASRRRAPRNARAWCIASMSARAGSWWWRRPSAPTRR